MFKVNINNYLTLLILNIILVYLKKNTYFNYFTKHLSHYFWN